MRFPSISTFIRGFSLYNLNFTGARTVYRGVQNPLLRNTTLRSSMPTVPFLGALFGSGGQKDMTDYPVKKSDEVWQVELNKRQFEVVRGKDTEAPFSGRFDTEYHQDGTYNCVACKEPLYTANHKFKSGCGWPAFFDAIPGKVIRHTDRMLGMARTEIVCANCGGHLGHVFKGEGYPTPTNERHCVNSVSLKFKGDDGRIFVDPDPDPDPE